MILAVPRVCEKVFQRITMRGERRAVMETEGLFCGQKVGAGISEYREMKKKIPLGCG